MAGSNFVLISAVATTSDVSDDIKYKGQTNCAIVNDLSPWPYVHQTQNSAPFLLFPNVNNRVGNKPVPKLNQFLKMLLIRTTSPITYFQFQKKGRIHGYKQESIAAPYGSLLLWPMLWVGIVTLKINKLPKMITLSLKRKTIYWQEPLQRVALLVPLILALHVFNQRSRKNITRTVRHKKS